jgi:crotonobetainyl-CoA:carnitine CoA-transferase CaiB-like acyl-CoA transferase
MAGPLDGIRIIDLTQMISGPMATMILADQGADVIKVEPPGIGDLTRAMGGRKRGMSPTFAVANRNKRSIVINLKGARGVDLLKRMVAQAEVLVQNFRPGAAERMGVGYEAMREVRPELIYVSISGFGEQGPYVHKRTYDPVIQALSGLMSIQADETGRPRMIRVIVPDKVTALTAAQAITAAIVARLRTGKGQHVRLAMLDAVVAFIWPESMPAYTFVGTEPTAVQPPGTRDLVFETTDGYITAAANSDVEWAGLARTLGHPEWIEDPRFKHPADRIRNADVRLDLTAAIIRTKSAAEWLTAFDAAEVPCAPIQTRAQLLTDPQVAANGLILESDHPHAGRMRQPRPAARFEATPAALRRFAPTLGEDTEVVLEEAGVPSAERASLRQSGVIA